MLRMSPGERHCRARGPAANELALGNIRCVPDLLWNEIAVARETFQCREERLCPRSIAGGQLIVGALAREQRPWTPETGAVECRAVLVLTVTVAVVAPPTWTRGQIGLENGVDHANGIENARIVRRSYPETHERA